MGLQITDGDAVYIQFGFNYIELNIQIVLLVVFRKVRKYRFRLVRGGHSYRDWLCSLRSLCSPDFDGGRYRGPEN